MNRQIPAQIVIGEWSPFSGILRHDGTRFPRLGSGCGHSACQALLLASRLRRYVRDRCPWVGQIQEWNPRLTEQDCFTVLKAWLGRRFAGGQLSSGHGFGISSSLLRRSCNNGNRARLAAVSEPEKIVPWVDTGTDAARWRSDDRRRPTSHPHRFGGGGSETFPFS